MRRPTFNSWPKFGAMSTSAIFISTALEDQHEAACVKGDDFQIIVSRYYIVVCVDVCVDRAWEGSIFQAQQTVALNVSSPTIPWQDLLEPCHVTILALNIRRQFTPPKVAPLQLNLQVSTDPS